MCFAEIETTRPMSWPGLGTNKPTDRSQPSRCRSLASLNDGGKHSNSGYLYVCNPDPEPTSPVCHNSPDQLRRQRVSSVPTIFAGWREIDGLGSESADRESILPERLPLPPSPCSSPPPPLPVFPSPSPVSPPQLPDEQAEQDRSSEHSSLSSYDEPEEPEIMDIPACHSSYSDPYYSATIAVAAISQPFPTVDKPLPTKPLPPLIRNFSFKGLKRTLSSITLMKKRTDSFSSVRSGSEPPHYFPSTLPMPSTGLTHINGMKLCSLEAACRDDSIRYRGI